MGTQRGIHLLAIRLRKLLKLRHLSRSNSDTICANTWFILSAGVTNQTRDPAEAGGGINYCLSVD